MPSPLHSYLGECLPRGVFRARRDGRLREFPRTLLCASLLLCVICTSCGAVGSGTPPPSPAPATVTVTPSSAQLFPGENKQFSAVVENASSSAVNWQVSPASNGNTPVGSISPTGYYTAPNSISGQATVTVTAVLKSDPAATGSASVTILTLSSITGPLVVSPALSSLTTSQTLQLHVMTPGVSNSDVSWAVDGGTITPGGMYSPPSAQGAYTVKATLIANPNAIGTAQVDVTNFPGNLTWRNDNARLGVNSQELALAPATVSSSTFGKLFSCPIDGYAYAQPLYVPNLLISGETHNVVFVATEKDSVFAFDADANANPCVPLWQTSLIPKGSQAIATPNLDITSTDILPFVGITGTPVISASTSVLFVVAAMQTIGATPPYSQRLYALDLATGLPIVQPAGVVIATQAGQATTFIPTLENQRPALLLDPLENGVVYVAFGSFGGEGDYHGWLFGYDASSLQQTGVFVVTQSPAIQGGIWQGGGGPSADSNGNIFVATGEGPFNANRTLESFSYGDSFLHLGTTNGLSASDYFTPCDEGAAQIVGTGAPVLLPDSAGSTLQPHLLISGSKGVAAGGSLYVVNRDSMGGFCPGSSTAVQTIPVAAGPIMSTPLFWNNAIYVAPGNGSLMSFPMTGGILASSSSASKSPETLGPQGATPVLSSNGLSNAILWLIDSSGALATPNSPAILRAYDPNNLSNEIYNSTMAAGSRDQAGPAVKFTVPTVANGKVYVGTQTELDVYGLLP
jgi:hypothetical protein